MGKALLVLGVLAFQERSIEDKVTRIIAEFENASSEIRERASRDLVEIGPEALPALSKLRPTGPEALARIREAQAILYGKKEFRILDAHASYVTTLAFSPDGALLASGGWDGNLHLWDAKSFKRLHTLNLGPSTQLRSIAFSPDGRSLAAGYGGSVGLWNVESRRPLAQMNIEIPTEIVFSSDGKRLYVGSRGGEIKVLDASTLKEERALRGHRGPVQCIGISTEDRWLASGGDSKDPTVRLWNPRSGEELRTLMGHPYGIFHVRFTPKGDVLVSESPTEWASHVVNPSTLRIWDPSTGNEVGRLSGRQAGSMVFSRDGTVLIVGTHAGDLVGWDWKAGKIVFELTGHAGAPSTGEDDRRVVSALALSPDGRILASGGYDQTMHLWYVSALLAR